MHNNLNLKLINFFFAILGHNFLILFDIRKICFFREYFYGANLVVMSRLLFKILSTSLEKLYLWIFAALNWFFFKICYCYAYLFKLCVCEFVV